MHSGQNKITLLFFFIRSSCIYFISNLEDVPFEIFKDERFRRVCICRMYISLGIFYYMLKIQAVVMTQSSKLSNTLFINIQYIFKCFFISLREVQY